jgi:hypothetical protein
MSRRDGQATGMAGEFRVMELLLRLGHTPALTMGNTKKIDILVKTKRDQLSISVKSNCGGGKWMLGDVDNDAGKDLFYVLLYYKNFEAPEKEPIIYVIPSLEAKELTRIMRLMSADVV